ncbi:cobalt-precorrin-6A reductase [Williamsia sp. CHRR-6]|nr:cobalt-precorrin-6A reductase [Williamsia sp. CHRR-6]
MTDPAPILILGGTGEARALAQVLHAERIPCVSSLAGRVSDPALPAGDVRSGGFGGVDGLIAWLRAHRCTTVVDATHPFAQHISAHAAQACTRLGIRLIGLQRRAWSQVPGDQWISVPDLAEAADWVGQHGRRVFLTTGRQDVHEFAHLTEPWFLIRVVDPPTCNLPRRHHILRSRGPYVLDAERKLMVDNDIDVLVTKNSGGELTAAKLAAARELGLPVVMVQRPPQVPVDVAVDSVDDAVSLLRTAAR